MGRRQPRTGDSSSETGPAEAETAWGGVGRRPETRPELQASRSGEHLGPDGQQLLGSGVVEDRYHEFVDLVARHQ